MILITTAADDNFCDIIPNFRKKSMIFHENRLPADESHEYTAFLDVSLFFGLFVVVDFFAFLKQQNWK